METPYPPAANGHRPGGASPLPFRWHGPSEAVDHRPEGVWARLADLGRPLFLLQTDRGLGVAEAGQVAPAALDGAGTPCAVLPPATPEGLGDAAFREAHGVRYAYQSGAMANGIASEALVVAMGQAGLLGAFGAAGLAPPRVEGAIAQIQRALPHGPYAFNLIHSPSEPALEQQVVDLFLRYGVRTVEASAFLDLTPAVVHYRVAGLAATPDGSVMPANKIIAKVSRREVAEKFMEPPPDRILAQLLQRGLVTEAQARMAATVPVADDVTVEADSGGHTDNRPLVGLLPSLVELRDEVQRRRRYARPVRVGAGGGLGTPQGVLAAFALGAGYVVTGSVNQSALEAGTSPHAKELLAQAGMADVMMTPAADMFEMGVKVQVLKRGTMYPMRAQKLYELYRAYGALEELPPDERAKLERQVFQKSLDEVWQDTVRFFEERDPSQIARAAHDPKRKMALVFRWYLGQSSHWANAGAGGRAMDYQIWCGPAMGAFNDWVRGTYLERAENRGVVDIAHHLMWGAAYLDRLRTVRQSGVRVDPASFTYKPQPFKGAAAHSVPA